MAGKRVGRWGCSALLGLIALAACTPPGSGDPSLLACLVDTEVAVDDLGRIPPGFSLSPAEARARALGSAVGDVDRHDGVVLDLTLTIDAAGAMTLQRRSWQTPPGGGRAEDASGTDCEDAYALPVTVAVQALPDLDLAEATTLTVTARGRATFHLRVDAAAHRGTAAPADGDVDDDVTAIDLLLDARRDDGPWSGEAGFGIERRHGPGPDGSVSYAFSPWGAWQADGVGPTSP